MVARERVETRLNANPLRDKGLGVRHRLQWSRVDADELMGGGARRDRTADLLHAMQALSQLSYTPISGKPEF